MKPSFNMENKKIFGILSAIIMIQGLLVLTSALDVEQGISAKVVPGIIDIYSPVSETVFQDNLVLFDLKIRSFSNTVKNLWLIEGNNMKLLCSGCDEFNKEIFFSSGDHAIRLKAEFVNGDIAEKETSFTIDANSNIYLSSNGLVKKATTKELLNYLENYDFKISYKREKVPDDFCSIRAKDGNVIIGDDDFGTNGKVNLYSVLKLDNGQGSLSAQKNRKRFSLSFKVTNTLENSDELLKLEIADKKSDAEFILEYDKVNKKVKITGDNLLIDEMNAYFVEGCSSKKDTFYLIEKGKKMKRSTEEIRKILRENPIFVNRYENLRFVFKSFWKVREVLGLY